MKTSTLTALRELFITLTFFMIGYMILPPWSLEQFGCLAFALWGNAYTKRKITERLGFPGYGHIKCSK